MVTVPHVLMALGALVAWALAVLVFPHGRCRRCRGQRFVVRRRGLAGRRQRGNCPRCKGSGKAPRLGARTVHRLLWLALADLARRREKEIR